MQTVWALRYESNSFNRSQTPVKFNKGRGEHPNESMNSNQVKFYPSLTDSTGTCTEAEMFALCVEDDSMQPEFAKGCIVVIDPTGLACHNAYVIAKVMTEVSTSNSQKNIQSGEQVLDQLVFRQLVKTDNSWQLQALNTSYPTLAIAEDLSTVIGIVVQRAGARRSYHKRYDETSDDSLSGSDK